MEQRSKALIDRILNATISKKLTVFLLATFFFYDGKLESEDWVKLTFVYLGVQGAIDLFNSVKTKYNESRN